MIVGVNLLAVPRHLHDFQSPLGDHLVGVHVGRGARAGLKNIDYELLVEFAVYHLTRRLANRPRDRRVEQAELLVGRSGGVFDQPKSTNELRRETDTADRKVFNGALRLRAIVGVFRHLDFAHGIPFDTKSLVSHWTSGDG